MRAKKRNRYDLATQLRRAIRKSGLTPYRIATDADVDRAIMTRFVNGDHGLTLDTASRICEVLDLQLQPAARQHRKGA